MSLEPLTRPSSYAQVDPALRRPGRLDREFYFPLPDAAARLKVPSPAQPPPPPLVLSGHAASLTPY